MLASAAANFFGAPHCREQRAEKVLCDQPEAESACHCASCRSYDMVCLLALLFFFVWTRRQLQPRWLPYCICARLTPTCTQPCKAAPRGVACWSKHPGRPCPGRHLQHCLAMGHHPALLALPLRGGWWAVSAPLHSWAPTDMRWWQALRCHHTPWLWQVCIFGGVLCY